MERDTRTRFAGQPSGRWRLGDLKGRTLAFIQFGALLVFGLALALGLVLRGSFRGSWEMAVTFAEPIDLLIMPAGIVAVLLLHEAVHALLLRALGGRVRFGAKLIGRILPALYATSDVRLRRNQYLVVGLGPFVLITAALLPAGMLVESDGAALLALALMALNAGGSAGDMVLAHRLRVHARGTLFQDKEDGFIWWSDPASG